MSIVVPGDALDSDSTLYGPGIYANPLTNEPLITKCGILRETAKRGSAIKYIDTNGKRYVPEARDHVLGVVVGKMGESFRVLLQDHVAPVTLSQFAFENATKRNRPNLPNGTLVYGRIIMADKDIEAEMECVDSSTGRACGFGELKGGYVFPVSLAYARQLLFNGEALLGEIGKLVAFEIAIGLNGKVWVEGQDIQSTWKIAQCIQECERIPPAKAKETISRILASSNK
jgi:exosome complex component RRP40